ncbi:MAG: NADH-quinone oxidoreductase subunit NuoF [Clostridiales Family XIII bacterium]|jgi:NADP-reducing hydrogenase subunit HndC|nr:NADH-quinone oxidoreductase subunit NuoF [Clostridiales Family XIII bacterium]
MASKTLQDLAAIREKMQRIVGLRGGDEAAAAAAAEAIDPGRINIMICAGTGCTASMSGAVSAAFTEEIEKAGLTDVKVVKTGCFGLCAMGPIVVVYPDASFYCQVKAEDVAEIVQEHIVGGHPVKRLLYDEDAGTEDAGKHKSMSDTSFYRKQMRVALRNCGLINPENIDEYIAYDGYKALGKVLTEMSPDEVIETVLASGIRGRGGAGFPTGMKWKFASGARGEVQKYVCCNADEGDPGAFMDRSVLEGDPHVVLEAMAIAGYAIGADKGYIYVRAEYPIAVQRLSIALAQAHEYGLIGQNIFGTDFSFDVEIKLGAGAFVCGEETALMTSIEGHRGEPRPRPPFPAVKGLFESPTILNNVETYANIPRIILNGAEWYSSIGTEKSKGTKVFALGGKIENIGLVEVPMGTTLREIVEEIGGGIPGGHEFKAAQTGGPSGGCIPASHLDTPIDYDNLVAIGSMMGSGGLIVMDETTCMVDIARFFLEFTVDESCGKCTPCRVGNRRMLEILEKIAQGKASIEDLDKLDSLASYIKANSLCGLGQTAPNPVLSTIRYFRPEYEAHILEKRCPAGVCKALLTYKVDAEKCKGCTLCAKKCPAEAISGAVKEAHTIDIDKCIKCGVCMDNCKFDAISRS